MKNYDFEIKNYAGTFKAKNGCIYGSIDYIGKNGYRKRVGNGFIVYPNKKIAFDYPYDIPVYLLNYLKTVFC